MRSLSVASWALLAASGLVNGQESDLTSFKNPILPGWHSDPSCIYVPEPEDTFFCAASTFLAFPGIPIYASKDLVNWKLASHAWNRVEQFPGYFEESSDQSQGIYAPTLREHNGTFYLVTSYIYDGGNQGTVFKTDDLYDDEAWSDPVLFDALAIDPDLFWDDDETVYLTSQGIILQNIDLETGETTEPTTIWEGTGGVWPEGPHMYKKDGYYYLMIAEGGTAMDHSETIARSKEITGPYESFEGNPILTNRGTEEYFQTVGHADLFEDKDGNWWGVALATRCGPDYKVFPMGRETVLYPATWEEGEWPVLDQVQGLMTDAPLPPRNRNITRGSGPFVQAPDVHDFEPGSDIPPHFVYWRAPPADTFAISTAEDPHPNTLRLSPTQANLTGSPDFTGKDGLSFISRRQEHSIFNFSVDLFFTPEAEGDEAGATFFLTQFEHIDMGVVLLPLENSTTDELAPHFRFGSEGRGNADDNQIPEGSVTPIPADWLDESGDIAVRLQVQAMNTTHLEFRAMPQDDEDKIPIFGHALAVLLSGGQGKFTGSLVGVYATCNGGEKCGADAHFGRWRYDGLYQEIGD
ncbi:hypothetical protein FQN54_003297 [Arachnomyces sp. PD_36]|nr:hypothetical protein FQN54_003297 [Arachnomyces sp. PD_36]